MSPPLARRLFQPLRVNVVTVDKYPTAERQLCQVTDVRLATLANSGCHYVFAPHAFTFRPMAHEYMHDSL